MEQSHSRWSWIWILSHWCQIMACCKTIRSIIIILLALVFQLPQSGKRFLRAALGTETFVKSFVCKIVSPKINSYLTSPSLNHSLHIHAFSHGWSSKMDFHLQMLQKFRGLNCNLCKMPYTSHSYPISLNRVHLTVH